MHTSAKCKGRAQKAFNIYDLSSHQRHFSLKWMNFNQVLQAENVMSIIFGIRKTGPKEKWPSVKNAL